MLFFYQNSKQTTKNVKSDFSCKKYTVFSLQKSKTNATQILTCWLFWSLMSPVELLLSWTRHILILHGIHFMCPQRGTTIRIPQCYNLISVVVHN